MRKFKGFVIAANASGAGKTTAAIGLICALRERGIEVFSAKCGPDYIDSSWLALASGKPCANLDLWMCGRKNAISGILDLYGEPEGIFSAFVVEGAMGLYDGGENSQGSTAQLAAMLDLPILLLLNVKGMGQSAGALAEGFLGYAAPRMLKLGHPGFIAVLPTNVSSEKHWNICRKAMMPVLKKFNVPLAGYLGKTNLPQIHSRHLGLILAGEAPFEARTFADWFSSHCNPEHLLDWAAIKHGRVQNWQSEAKSEKFFTTKKKLKADCPRIAIACDEAFSFCYADLPAMLSEFGAEAVFFSPLRDSSPPPCDGIYFPGGYPELHCRELENNIAMKQNLRSLAANGIPIYGECGGFIYLGHELRDVEGKTWRMSGLLPVSFAMQTRLAALGYRQVIINDEWLSPEKRLRARGHEFHYAKIENQPAGIWEIKTGSGKRADTTVLRQGNITGTWMHLYPRGSRAFWRAWITKVYEYGKKNYSRFRGNAR